MIPSFSLGIDEDIYGHENDYLITPKPALREKSTRVPKVSRFSKSPYIERVVDINANLTSQDRGLWRFMIQRNDPVEHMFNFTDFFCLREDMQTLKINHNQSTSVIDTWAIILNDNEKYKVDESPMRLFCTIGCVSISMTYPLFEENMDEMLNRFNRTKLETMDMVFFPIIAYEHFYMISYNIKNPAYEIIDNTARDEDPKICYGNKPKILHSHFIKYLKAKGHMYLDIAVVVTGHLSPSVNCGVSISWQGHVGLFCT
ncbi:hypothetical protein POM88_026661 [Heracleum sosnowskyi]|uniref:Ubiquitin-like protease family profile domain-containing protein n=1 Tax=Heracleum sosnowskyi TaxID=360622 RepID=A0AAD8I8K4_9APIA|nr:hypothetical protein POM88_026661 [Heracleum sosnowskyi]